MLIIPFQFEKIQQEIQNYLNFIKIGNLSKTVSEALTEAEKRNEELTAEIGSLEFQKNNSFKTPPKEWINHRLENLRETLNKNTVSSSLALKKLLAPISLEPVLTKESDFYQLFEGNERNFKPYYVAHTKIRTLALLDEEQKGSNWYQWRTRLQPIRTASEIQVKIIIKPIDRIPLYQRLAKKVEELLLLGMSFRAIGRSLNVSKRTIMRAYNYTNRPTQEEK